MNFIKTYIEGVYIIEPRIFQDQRGYFFESFSAKEFESAIGKVSFVQDNESMSVNKGVLRGLHFQKGDFAQAKLLRVAAGRVFDVAVDIREGSPTYGKYVSVELSYDNKRMLFIPRGMAHGFLVLEDHTIFQYKCDNYYTPSAEGCIIWNDSQIAIKWPIDGLQPILSPKDQLGISFCNYQY